MSEFTPISEIISSVFSDIETAINSAHGFSGLSTGLSSLDDLVMGLDGGELAVIAGHHDSGRDQLLKHIAINNALSNSVLYVSYGNTAKDIMHGMVCQINEINISDFALIKVSKLNEDKAKKLRDSNLYFCETSDTELAIQAITGFALDKRIKENKEPLIIVDGLSVYEANTTGSLQLFKFLAKELNCPIVVNSTISAKNLNRVNKRPILKDLDSNHHAEEIASKVLLTYFDPELHDFSGPTEMEIEVAKNSSGQTGRVIVSYDENTGTIKDF